MQQVLLTYVGHATVRIESGGQSLITDPNFSEKIFWLKRRCPGPIPVDQMPQPTAILLSHAHYDHLDLPSYKYFTAQVPIIAPPGLKPLLNKFLKNPVIELEPGASVSVGSEIRITACLVTHLGFRLLPIRYTRCNGYLIEWDGKKIFFPGDTAYRSDFRAQVGEVDVALLPISCYKPEWFMRSRHIDPAQAVRIFEEIGAKIMIPIHWGTFKLSTEPLSEPIEWLKRIAKEKGIKAQIKILQPGDQYKPGYDLGR